MDLNSLQQSLQGLTLDSVNAELARRSYYEFFKQAWNVLEPETPYNDNWHVKYLCDILQEEAERIDRREPRTEHLIINIPPRSLKSLIVTVMFNAWVWINYPSQKFMTTSYSNDLAVEHGLKTRRLIESNWYQDNWGDRFDIASDQNVKSKFENSKTGSRRSSSVGGTITGLGADYIIVDDPLKAQDAYSEVARDKVAQWYSGTMFSRLNDLEIGLRIVVMQRLHEEDLTGILLNKKGYRHICLPAIESENIKPEALINEYKDKLFSPVRFSASILDDARESLGSLEYEGQYQQAPSPAEGNIFKRSWFETFDKLDGEYQIHSQTDGAYGKENSDNTATIVYTVKDNNLYIWAVYGWNLDFPSFITEFKRLLPRHNMGSGYKAYFEPKAMGISAVQTLKSVGINAIEDKPPTESKESRVRASSARAEAGRVFLYSGGVGMEDLILEAIKFPTGKNDDRVDCLAMIINRELVTGKKVTLSWA